MMARGATCTGDANCPVPPDGRHTLACPKGQMALVAAQGSGSTEGRFAPGWEAEVYVRAVQGAISELATRYADLATTLHRLAADTPADLRHLGIDFTRLGGEALDAIRATQGNADTARLLKRISEAEAAQHENPAPFITYRKRTNP